MRQLRQLSLVLDSMPVWGQILLAIGLALYCIVSVYGRINTKFGAKVFSKIPEDQINTDKFHIMQYTFIPLIVTVGYLVLLAAKYSQ